jgi:hypothetical protein
MGAEYCPVCWSNLALVGFSIAASRGPGHRGCREDQGALRRLTVSYAEADAPKEKDPWRGKTPEALWAAQEDALQL